jgi:ribosome-associated translation inhibitor RaiA
MKRQNTQIVSKDSVLDLKQNSIDAKFDTTIKDKTFAVKVSGETSNPKISLDAKDLLKEQLNKQLEKKKDKIQEKLNKVLGKKADDAKTKQLIDDIKSMVK